MRITDSDILDDKVKVKGDEIFEYSPDGHYDYTFNLYRPCKGGFGFKIIRIHFNPLVSSELFNVLHGSVIFGGGDKEYDISEITSDIPLNKRLIQPSAAWRPILRDGVSRSEFNKKMSDYANNILKSDVSVLYADVFCDTEMYIKP